MTRSRNIQSLSCRQLLEFGFRQRPVLLVQVTISWQDMVAYASRRRPEMFDCGDPLSRAWERNNPKPRDEAEMSLPVITDCKVFEDGSEALLFQLLISSTAEVPKKGPCLRSCSMPLVGFHLSRSASATPSSRRFQRCRFSGPCSN